MGPPRISLLAFALCAGCAFAGSAALKSPVQEQCESVGLSGCPQMAEGVVLYADGKQAEGVEKLKAGAAANNPDQVRDFAKGLALVTSLPGVDRYAGPVHQIAELLATEADAAARVSAKSAPPGDTDKLASTAPVPAQGEGKQPKQPSQAKAQAVQAEGSTPAVNDGPAIERIVSESTPAWSGRRQCHLFGEQVSCGAVQQGPFIVTDVQALPGCDDVMYLGSNRSDNPYKEAVTYTFKWVVEATEPGVHGTLLAVQPGESLLVAVKPREGGFVENPKCIVTWSGYHPARRVASR